VYGSWLQRARRPSFVRRGFRYAIVVGNILIAINYGPELLRGELSLLMRFAPALTVLVPYVVSTLASVEAVRD
jgi:hypothetical protein